MTQSGVTFQALETSLGGFDRKNTSVASNIFIAPDQNSTTSTGLMKAPSNLGTAPLSLLPAQPSMMNIGYSKNTSQDKLQSAEQRIKNLKENSVNNLMSEKKEGNPMFILDHFMNQEDKIVKNSGQLGVEGIRVPISGSPAARNGAFYQISENGLREDIKQTQTTTSDMVQTIRNREMMKPSYVEGGKEKSKMVL